MNDEKINQGSVPVEPERLDMGRRGSSALPDREPYTRKTYSQRLGEFCKQLRDIVDGKISPESTVHGPQSGDWKTSDECRVTSGEMDKPEQARLPYADE